MTTLDHILTIGTGLVTVMSAVASLINHVVRSRQEAGKPVAPALLGAGAVINLASVNVDKALQLAKLFKSAKAETSTPADSSKP